ncbi:HutP family protein [Rhodobacter maris]|uniref:Hut operon positive regulatory protein n=1 Tax=Rhodobacter maris TaxID=446682 RepID=A0A285TBI1_9RHOB|nr:HutP family protein [Rhodobacter maris]SOC19033.1 hut operon positive regulator [Rhodobacter maris]
MEIVADRIGKAAIMAAISSREEEDRIKAQIAERPDWKIGITYVTGRRTDIERGFVKSIVACALNSGVIRHRSQEIHGVIHAGLECLHGVSASVVAESNLKLKVALVSDGHWVAVAAHGESAFHPLTNHERIGFGVMHI